MNGTIERREVALAALVTLGILVVTATVVQPIAFNQGYGNDGLHYADMARRFAGTPGDFAQMPYVTRIGPPFLAGALTAGTGLHLVGAFFLVNAAMVITATALLYVLLRLHAIGPRLAMLGVVWWAALPFTLRWTAYYPVQVDGFAAAVLLGLLVAATTRNLGLFALILTIGATGGERPFVAVPFLFLILLPHAGARGAALRTMAASVPALVLFLAIQRWPPLAPSSAGGASFASAPLAVLAAALRNENGFAVRPLLAAPLSLGLLAALPFVFGKESLAFLRRSPAWCWWLAATFVLGFVSETDRVFVQLAPLCCILAFGAPSAAALWARPGTTIALSAVHLIAVRFLVGAGTDLRSYLDEMVTWMSTPRLVALALYDTVVLAAGAAIAVVFRRSERST